MRCPCGRGWAPRQSSNSKCRFVDAFLTGTFEAYGHADRSLEILAKVTASKPSFLAASTKATLPLLGRGCVTTGEWARFGAWMFDHGLLKKRVPTSDVVTTRFLGTHCQKRAGV